MATTPTKQDFWTHPYVTRLTAKGRLALSYVMFMELEDNHVILEDMAYFTGYEIGECRSWLKQFRAANVIPKDTRWS